MVGGTNAKRDKKRGPPEEAQEFPLAAHRGGGSQPTSVRVRSSTSQERFGLTTLVHKDVHGSTLPNKSRLGTAVLESPYHSPSSHLTLSMQTRV